MTRNLLGEIPPTLLPDHPDATAALARARAGEIDLAAVVAQFPAVSAVWAELAEQTLQPDASLAQEVTGYAFARVGYHRGLDALRRAGWKGAGPVPWSHAPNQGFLRCLAALARAAGMIGEADEAARCAKFLADCDPAAADQL